MLLINAIISCNRTPTTNPYPTGETADASECGSENGFHMKGEKGVRKPHRNRKVKIHSPRLSLYLWDDGVCCKLFLHLEERHER